MPRPISPQRVAEQFEGPYELRFHLAPPLLADRDPATGHLKKRVYGPWMLGAFRALARLRRLRGTAFDPFGRTAERRTERRLIAEYETILDEIERVPVAGEPSSRRRIGASAARHPRLRSRQGGKPEARQGPGSRIARPLPRAVAACSRGCGVMMQRASARNYTTKTIATTTAIATSTAAITGQTSRSCMR